MSDTCGLPSESQNVLPGKHHSKGHTKTVLKVDSPDKKARRRFLGSNCICWISVGNPACDGELLSNTFKLINSAGFAHCTIGLADTLQRHTLRLKVSAEEELRWKMASENGDNWIKRNMDVLGILSMPYTVVRWDNLLSHSDMSHYRQQFDKKFTTDEVFASAFETFTATFIRRYQQIHSIELDEEGLGVAKDLCMEYAKEETCVIKSFWATNQQLHFGVYPCKLPSEFKRAIDDFCSDCNRQFLEWVYLKKDT